MNLLELIACQNHAEIDDLSVARLTSCRRPDDICFFGVPEETKWMAELRVCQVWSAMKISGNSSLTSHRSEVFVIVSLTLFLPICLEQFARDNGFLVPDRTEPCTPIAVNSNSTVVTVAPNARCVVKIGWAWIDSASFRWASKILLSSRTSIRWLQSIRLLNFRSFTSPHRNLHGRNRRPP